MEACERDTKIIELKAVCKPVISAFSRRLTPSQQRWLSTNDLEQIAIIPIIYCVELGKTSKSYVTTAVRNELIEAIWHPADEEPYSVRSLSDLVGTASNDDEAQTLADLISSNDPTPEDLLSKSEQEHLHLSEYEHAIVALRLHGYSFRAIGVQLGTSRDTIRRTYNRIIARFKNEN